MLSTTNTIKDKIVIKNNNKKVFHNMNVFSDNACFFWWAEWEAHDLLDIRYTILRNL